MTVVNVSWLRCRSSRVLIKIIAVFVVGWVATRYMLQDRETFNSETDESTQDVDIRSLFQPNRNTREIQQERMANKEQGRTMEEIQEERRQRVREYCTGSNDVSIEEKELAHFLVDEQHKIFLCLNYKAASRQLTRVIASLIGVQRTGYLPRDLFTWGSNFSPKEKVMISQTYFTIVFVREPLVRLLSAFLDKFYRVPHPQYRLSYGRTIIARYRPNASQQSLEKGNDVQFREFAQFVLDGNRDEHWQLVNVRCFPCAIKYDFIGRFENFQEELPHIFKAAGVPEVPLKLPYKSHNVSAEVHHYYSQLSRSTILQLAEIYRPDYVAFGYPFPGPLFEDLVSA